jgi:nitroreductase/NAD-dependent dihydropyrimidine dehydrogenase PreA subunit
LMENSMANLLSVTEGECTRCGDCAAACPIAFVRVGSRGPRTLPEAQERCMLCGHCIAACPTGTLRHSRLPDDQCLALDANWRGDVHAVEQLIKGRRSIRRYQPQPVDRSTLLAVLDMARFAPTGMNSQSVKWLVVYEAAEVKKLAGAVIYWMRSVLEKGELVAGKYDPSPLVRAWEAGFDAVLRGCPHVLIAYGREGDPMAHGSCIAALTTAELAAIPLGLGTCWAGFLHMAAILSPPARQALGLPDGHVMHGALMIGHPLEKHYRIPPRKEAEVSWR